MKVVARVFKIVVLLLVVAAVTTILLTPTPTDDVPGVMHSNHSPLAVAVIVGVVQVASLSKSLSLLQETTSHPLMHASFLELACQHLC